MIKAIPPTVRWLRIENSYDLTDVRSLPKGLLGLSVEVQQKKCAYSFYQKLGPVTMLPPTLAHLTLRGVATVPQPDGRPSNPMPSSDSLKD